MGERALQYFKDLDAEIFRSRHGFREFLQGIQIFQVVAGEHFLLHALIEIDQVADHTRALIDLAADCYLEHVIVAVSVGIIALAVGRLVFAGGHLLVVQAVRGREEIAASEVGFHEGC